MVRQWVVVLIIFVVFWNSLTGISGESLGNDEAWIAWTIRDESRNIESLRDIARLTRDSIWSTTEVVFENAHPPLYFFFLDVWSLIMGESEFTLRIPSMLMSVLSLAGVYFLGRFWFNKWVGIIALLFLGTSGFFVYTSGDAGLFAFSLALITLTTIVYSFYWRNPNLKIGFLYTGLMILAVSTHYVAGLVFIAQGIHLLLTRQLSVKPSIPFISVGIVSTSWLVILLRYASIEMQISFNQEVFSFLTIGSIVNVILLVIVSRIVADFLREKTTRQAIVFLLLWIVLPFVILVSINIFHFIVIVPAWSILLAVAIDRIRFSGHESAHRLQILAQGFFVVLIVSTQISTFDTLWSAKPRWREVVESASEMRQSNESGLINFSEQSPVAYYDHQFSVADGISIDIGWRDFTPIEIQSIATYLDSESSVWVIADMPDPQSWSAVAGLAQGRGVGYRDSVDGTIFYRFDESSTEPLELQFEVEDDHSVPIVWDYRAYGAGESICPDSLNRSYTTVIVLVYGNDDSILRAENTCLTIPENAENSRIEMSILDENGNPLPVIENGEYWGDSVVLGYVDR